MRRTFTPLEMLERLVAFDTVSARSNLALIDWVAAYLADHGIAPVVLPGEDGTKANLYATIGPAEPGGIGLSGHTDVVPVQGQAWTSDPLALTRPDYRAYGAGNARQGGARAKMVVSLLKFGGGRVKSKK